MDATFSVLNIWNEPLCLPNKGPSVASLAMPAHTPSLGFQNPMWHLDFQHGIQGSSSAMLTSSPHPELVASPQTLPNLFPICVQGPFQGRVACQDDKSLHLLTARHWVRTYSMPGTEDEDVF